MTSAIPSVEQLIKTFDLMPHPEGGYFKETYRASESAKQTALPKRFKGERSFSTAIYYLLPEGAKSRLHRIASDEIWHFYLGGPLVVVEILSDGSSKKTTLGQDISKGQSVQYVVRAGNWFGAFPQEGTEYSFVGCTVAPGFDFSDFEMGDRSLLMAQYPNARKEIEQLTD
jgi:predicted cupin superfamily sugar epimerase